MRCSNLNGVVVVDALFVVVPVFDVFSIIALIGFGHESLVERWISVRASWWFSLCGVIIAPAVIVLVLFVAPGSLGISQLVAVFDGLFYGVAAAMFGGITVLKRRVRRKIVRYLAEGGQLDT